MVYVKTKEDMQEKLNALTDRFQIIGYVAGGGPSEIKDFSRDLIISYPVNNLIQKLKKNPDYIPKPRPEDRKKSLFRAKTKRKQTMQAVYGVTHPSKLQKNREKARESAKKYLHTAEIRDKRLTAASTSEAREKAKNTIEDRWGSLANPAIKAKKEQISLEKYGVPNPAKSKIVKDKIVATKIKNGNCIVIDGKTIKEWAKEKDVCVNTLNVAKRSGGEEAVRNHSSDHTDIESIMISILDDYKVQYVHDKQLEGTTYRPDFLLPDHNIIIECDGLYWHSDVNIDDKYYHQEKQKAYSDLGYRSFFFRSDELKNKKDIVSNIISNALGSNDRIFARNCTIEKISSDFFEQNHLMGKGAGQCFGLLYRGTIVAGIQAKWVNKITKELDISRFCTAPSTTVVGGFSKLLKHVESEYSPNYVRTFIDLRYGEGFYLSKLGFEYKDTHLSFKWTDGSVTYGRMTFPKSTGYEHSMCKIWDCGQAKWVKCLLNV